MNKQKTFWVSFLAIASVLVLISFASAQPQIANFTSVKVNGIETISSQSVAVTAGTSVPITVTFTANATESNVRLQAQFQGVNGDVQSEVFIGNVEAGQTYTQTLNIVAPSDIGDAQSLFLPLVVTVWNGDSSVTQAQYTVQLRDQRQSYNANVMSLSTVSTANAGDLLPVSVVLKNTGYDNLNDVYVIVSIPALNVQRSAYFGDLSNPVNSNDTVSGTVYLQLPSNATAGTYIVQAEVVNNYLDATTTTTFLLNNDFQNNVIADTTNQNTGVGQSATYNLELVNPTGNIKVYQIVPQTATGVSMSIDSSVIVPAGSSRTLPLTVKASNSGNYNLSVNVFSDGQMTGFASLALNAEGASVSNPVVILTIVFAVIFVVLLVVLLVLVTKKPKKQEGFNESYY